MKNKLMVRSLSLCVLLLFSSLPAAWAQNVIKADTTSMLTNSVNWLTADPGNGGVGTIPSSTAIGEFDATASANSMANMSLGGLNLVLTGLQFDNNMNGPLTLAAGNTLVVGTSGINMSSANTNVTINANYQSGTVQTWNVAANTTLSLNGTVLLDQSSSAANTDTNFPSNAGTQIITITGGGTVNVPNATLLPDYTGSTTGISSGSGVIVNGGSTLNGQGITIQRSANMGTTFPNVATPFTTPTGNGFIVNGNSVVNLGTLLIGGAFGNNPASANIINGNVTVTNGVTLGATPSNSNPARWGGFQIQAGSFTALDTSTGFVIATSPGGILNPMQILFSGGVSTIAKILIGSPLDPANATNTTAIFIKGGTLYVGSQGIARGNASPNTPPYPGTGAIGYQISLFSGMLGAYASWSSSLNMVLSSSTGTPFVIQTADSNGVPHHITLSGVISDGGFNAPLNVTGGGVLTLANTNIYTGVTTLGGGTVNVGAAETAGISGPLGSNAVNAAGTILFAGGTLQFSGANQNDYSGRFDNGTIGSQPISIDTAGQNVTFATAIQGAGTTLTKIGGGALTLTGANTYDTGTTINGGILNVNNASGSGTGSGTVTVGGGGTLGGSGTISGNVVVNSGGQTVPGASSPGNTLTIGGNLTYNTGSSAVFNLAASATGPGNDEIVLNGGSSTLTCGSTLTVNVTGAGLDSHDYVLYSVPSGTISGAFLSVPNFTGTVLANPQDYSVQKSGSQIILHYTSINPPVISMQTATPSPVQANQNVTFKATVTPGDYAVSTVVVNLSPMGGSDQALINTGGNSWSNTVTVPVSAFPNAYNLSVTATDISNNTTTVSVPLTVSGASGTAETWDGGVYGSSPNWSQNGNWTSLLAPGFGDNIFFAGATGPMPVMDQSYSLAGLTFSNGASSFTITNNASNGVLTLSGGATNNSSAQQILNVPVTVNAATVTVNDANSAGVVLGGVVSGPGADGLITAGNVALNNANTFAGTTAPASGTLTLSNALALQNSTLNYSSSGSVNFGSLTAATLGALSGSKNLPLENGAASPVALTVGGNNTSQTYSGSLTDTGNGASLNVTGGGSQTLSGTNTYTGPTTNGASSTFILGGGGELGNGNYAGAFVNNGTFDYQSTAAQTNSGIMSGTGALNVTGLGSLTLSGANSYSGVIDIGPGSKLAIAGAGQLASGNYSQHLTDFGTFMYGSSAAETLSGVISGNGALTINGTGKLTLSAANPAFTGATTVSSAGSTLQINNSSALQNSVLTLSAGAVAFGNNVTLVNLAGLAGSTNIALVDAGSPVTLSIISSSVQTFSGNLTDGGLGGNLSIGGAGQTLTGTNTFTGFVGIAAGNFTVGGKGQLGAGNYANYVSPQGGATFTYSSSAPQTFSGPNGTGGFEGGGSVAITGTGPVTLATSTALSGGGTLTIATNATLTLSAGAQLLSANYTGNYGQSVGISGTFNFNSSNNTTLTGVITGNYGHINVNGNTGIGQLTINNNGSTYSNSITTINGGILVYTGDGSVPGNNGTPGLVPLTVNTNIILNGGDLTGTGSFTLHTNRDIGIGLAAGNVGTNALIDSPGTFTIAGALVSKGNTGTNGLIVNSISTGTVILAGSNTFNGPITVASGTLSIGGYGVLQGGAYAGNITNNGTFDYSSSSAQTLSGVIMDGQTGMGTLSVGQFPASGTNTGVLTVTGANTYSGPTSISGGILVVTGGGTLLGGLTGNAGTFIKTGANVLILTNVNSFGGTNIVNNGTLALVGDGVTTGILKSAAVIDPEFPGIVDPSGLTSDGSLHVGDVNAGEGYQALLGNGNVVSNVFVGYYGTLQPGPTNGYGTLTVGHSLTIGDTTFGGGTIIMGVDHPITGGTNDAVAAASITILTNGSTPPTLTVVQSTNDLQTGDTFQLFKITGNTGVSQLNRVALTLPATSPDSVYNYVWNTNNLRTTGTIVLTAGAPAVSPAPTAGFSGSPTNIFVTQSVVFTNTSSGSITGWLWKFGDGNSLNTGAGTNVTHVYTVAGTNTVSLIVTGPGGSNTNTLANYVVVYPRLSIGQPVLSSGSLILSGASGGVPGAQYRILSTNLVTAPVATWPTVYTSVFGANGSYSYTNSPLTNGLSFFLLVSP